MQRIARFGTSRSSRTISKSSSACNTARERYCPRDAQVIQVPSSRPTSFLLLLTALEGTRRTTASHGHVLAERHELCPTSGPTPVPPHATPCSEASPGSPSLPSDGLTPRVPGREGRLELGIDQWGSEVHLSRSSGRCLRAHLLDLATLPPKTAQGLNRTLPMVSTLAYVMSQPQSPKLLPRVSRLQPWYLPLAAWLLPCHA